MPLTTRHRDGRRIDSTDDNQWAEVHIAGYEALFCPECRYRMHAVDGGGIRIRHFRHSAGNPSSCSRRAAESAEHLHVKKLVALAVRDLGWTAEIEYPGTGYQVDVLAISPHDGRRVAFEVQFSTIHASVAEERTRRHGTDDVETVWLDGKNQDSLRELRRALLWYRTDRQLVKTARLDPRGEWETRWAPLPHFVHEVCRRALLYDGGRWATPTDYAEVERKVAEQRRMEEERVAEQHRRRVTYLESEARQARRRAAMQWPLRVRATLEQLREIRRQHVKWAEQARRGAAMQWPLRMRDVRRRAEQAEQDRINAQWHAQRERARAERERVDAAWLADTQLYSGPFKDDTDDEVLELCERFADEYCGRVAAHTAMGWSRVGDRLHAECLRRGILRP